MSKISPRLSPSNNVVKLEDSIDSRITKSSKLTVAKTQQSVKSTERSKNSKPETEVKKKIEKVLASKIKEKMEQLKK